MKNSGGSSGIENSAKMAYLASGKTKQHVMAISAAMAAAAAAA